MRLSNMSKRRSSKKIILSLIAILLVVVTVIFMLGFTDKVEELFNCNHNSSYSTGVNAEATIKKFAQKNGLEMSDWPDELIDLLNRNAETESFVLNYPLKKDIKYDIDLDECDYSSSVPLFLQWDERWGYTPYGDDMIALSGCGPTCLSMVCVYLLNDTTYNPRYIAEFSEANGYCVPGNGSAWALISEGGPLLGLNVEELSLDENTVIQNLEAGNPIICVMGPGDFTSSGHFIVMTDYVDGKIKVNDPNSKARSEKLWEFEDIKSQINNLWACSVSDSDIEYNDYEYNDYNYSYYEESDLYIE